MHELQPLGIVRQAASVAVTMSRRMMDAMALRLESHRFPKAIIEQFERPALELCRNPQQ